MDTDKLQLVSIIRNVDPAFILPIADTLISEGIRSIEVSLSEPERGFGSLEKLAKRYSQDELFLGAGTVLRTEEVDRLNDLGIRFFFTPGFDGRVVDYAARVGIQVVPGVLTPSDVQQAVASGLTLLKLFPANAFPLSYIKGLQGPFPNTRYLAVGGVGPDNLTDYLGAGFLGAALGASLVPQNAEVNMLPKIREVAKKCVQSLGQL